VILFCSFDWDRAGVWMTGMTVMSFIEITVFAVLTVTSEFQGQSPLLDIKCFTITFGFDDISMRFTIVFLFHYWMIHHKTSNRLGYRRGAILSQRSLDESTLKIYNCCGKLLWDMSFFLLIPRRQILNY
jgi:hypothetical protein